VLRILNPSPAVLCDCGSDRHDPSRAGFPCQRLSERPVPKAVAAGSAVPEAEEELVVEEVGAVAKRAGAAVAAPSGASGELAPYRGERAAPARASCSRRAPRSSPMRAAARPTHPFCRCCSSELHPR